MSSSNSETTFGHRLIALLALCSISTSIGIFMKLSISGSGKFEYSPFSANCMTELYKLIVSLCIVGHLCRTSAKTSGREFFDEVKHFFEENLSVNLCLHVFGLTCMYVVVNFSVFGVMVYSTASNFFLLKASSPVITAMILVGVFGRPIHRAQWISIFAQSLGLISTQLDLCTKTTAVAWIGYLFIALNISVSCVAGVWNEHIIKTMAPSVNAQNVVMYLLGVIINFILFYTPQATKLLGGAIDERPASFLHGFDNWKVIGVVIANGSVGLVITAVYKYADVVVKTFGIAGSVVTLYLLETIRVLPSKTSAEGDRAGQGPIAFLGATIVFLASYLYILPKAPAATAATTTTTTKTAITKEQQQQSSIDPSSREELDPLKAESVDENKNDEEMTKLKKPEDQQQQQQNKTTSATAPAAILSSWSKMEYFLLVLCFFLGSIFTMSKC